jgi:hypothetical protein
LPVAIDKESLTASTDLEVVADGLVKRADPRHAQWDDGAVSILAGIMAFILSDAPPEKRNLMALREVLVQTDEDLRADAVAMMEVDDFDGLARSAGVAILTGLDNSKSMEADFIGAAKRHTKWLDKRAMRQVLEHSTFNLSDLKTGDASVYLVLPPDYLENDGAFLRLFVRCAISAMARGGSGKGKECLFILDEFFSLGKMNVVQTSSGSMPSYGVHLWPFMQDLGQLLVTYGPEGSETFFANADLHQFFGNADPLTLNHVSTRLGSKTASEVAMPNAPSAPISSGASMGRGLASLGGYSKDKYLQGTAGVLGGLLSAGEGAFQSARQSNYADQMQHYQQEMQRAMSQVGTPRYPPERIAQLVQQEPNKVAPHLINFVAGVGPIIVKPAPYFQNFKKPQLARDTQKIKPVPYDLKPVLIGLSVFLLWVSLSHFWSVLYLPAGPLFYNILTDNPVTNSIIIRAIISLFFAGVVLLSNWFGALKIGVSVCIAAVAFGLYDLFFGGLSESIAAMGMNHPITYLIPFYFW